MWLSLGENMSRQGWRLAQSSSVASVRHMLSVLSPRALTHPCLPPQPPDIQASSKPRSRSMNLHYALCPLTQTPAHWRAEITVYWELSCVWEESWHGDLGKVSTVSTVMSLEGISLTLAVLFMMSPFKSLGSKSLVSLMLNILVHWQWEEKSYKDYLIFYL